MRRIVFGALLAVAGAGPAAAAPGGTPPNVLMIVLDDVGADKLERFDFLAAPPYARTPTLDALADGGVRFTRFYTNPICSPTRALLQTGRYAFRTGMGANSEVYRLPDSELFLAELLRHGFATGNGYQSGAFGKWHIGQSDASHAVTNGYHRFAGHLANPPSHYAWQKYEQDEGGPLIGPSTANGWEPTIVRQDALAWITAQTDPFFAWVAFNPPHQQWEVPPFATLSAATQAGLAGYAEGQVAATPAERQLFFRAMLESVDTEIQALLDGIGPARLANTWVFVVCDNGSEQRVVQLPHVVSHGKPSGYELGIRVPLIISGPLVAQPVPSGGHVVDELVEAVDLWATIAALTGADVELAFQNAGYTAPYPRIDGLSILPLLLDPSASGPKEVAYSELFAPAGPYVQSRCLGVSLRSITDGEYKYMRWVNKPALGRGNCSIVPYVEELYHLPSDPSETNNLLLGTLSPVEQAAYDGLSLTVHHLSTKPGRYSSR